MVEVFILVVAAFGLGLLEVLDRQECRFRAQVKVRSEIEPGDLIIQRS